MWEQAVEAAKFFLDALDKFLIAILDLVINKGLDKYFNKTVNPNESKSVDDKENPNQLKERSVHMSQVNVPQEELRKSSESRAVNDKEKVNPQQEELVNANMNINKPQSAVEYPKLQDVQRNEALNKQPNEKRENIEREKSFIKHIEKRTRKT